MVKNLLQDVIPPDKRSIRHIPIPIRKDVPTTETRVYAERKPIAYREEKKVGQKVEQVVEKKPKKKNNKIRLLLWIGGILLIFLITYVVSLIFSGATLTVTAKQQVVPINLILSARKDPSAVLSFQLIKSFATSSISVQATGEEFVNRKASGKIIIYNNYSNATQRLIKNTRFESSNGKIYRINESIDVPGQKTVAGHVTPGSIETTIYADFPGPEYNIKLTDLKGDFTIAGFKGTPRYTSFYARLKTDITGGFSGKAKVVSDAVTKENQAKLQTELRSKLTTGLQEGLPKELISFPSGSFIEFELLPNTDLPNSMVNLMQRATLYTLAFNREILSKEVAKNSIKNFDGNDIEIPNLSKLDFALVGNSSTTKPWNSEIVNFSLKGQSSVIWIFNEEKLKNDLAGKPKKAISAVLGTYSAITSSKLVVQPFWRQTIPNDPERITIEKK